MINVWVLYQDIGNIPRSGVHLVSSFLTFNKRPLVYNRPQEHARSDRRFPDGSARGHLLYGA